MIDLGKGAQREIIDVAFTRYACYLVAQNDDPAKSEVAFAQTYFTVQTRKQEMIEQRLLDVARVPSGTMHAIRTDSNLWVSSFLIPVLCEGLRLSFAARQVYQYF